MTPATPIAAATAIVLRDGQQGLEVLMTERRADASFAAGAMVFPGGKVDPEDGGTPARALRAAAVRETFEECGIHLDADTLVPFAHWVTPADSRKRFDTWFFAARAPQGQIAAPAPHEVAELMWITPALLLAEASVGRKVLVLATHMNLLKLCRWNTVDEALAAAAEAPIVTVTPEWLDTPDGRVIVIPEAAGYGISRMPAGMIRRA